VPGLNAATLLSVWEEGASQSSPQRALTLLAAWSGTSRDAWARATVGERDRVLLLLREELFGARVEATASCPQCGTDHELAFRTENVRVPASEAPAAADALRVTAMGYEVSYRLVTSQDLVEIAEAADGDARGVLLRRCIRDVRRGGLAVDAAALPEPVLGTVIEEMARHDAQADVGISMRCSECAHPWSMPFDILTHLWSEIEEWAHRVLLDVHALASAYGWSERDILTMSARRRRLYRQIVSA